MKQSLFSITICIILALPAHAISPLVYEDQYLIDLYKAGDLDALAILVFQDCTLNISRADSLLEVLKEELMISKPPRYSWIEDRTLLHKFCKWMRNRIPTIANESTEHIPRLVILSNDYQHVTNQLSKLNTLLDGKLSIQYIVKGSLKGIHKHFSSNQEISTFLIPKRAISSQIKANNSANALILINNINYQVAVNADEIFKYIRSHVVSESGERD